MILDEIEIEIDFGENLTNDSSDSESAADDDSPSRFLLAFPPTLLKGRLHFPL